jgi:hypothetical protein
MNNFPGQIQELFLCHTLNEYQWMVMEDVYNQDNNNHGVMVASSEVLPRNRIALHLLTKLDNGTFQRNLIMIDENFAAQYNYL